MKLSTEGLMALMQQNVVELAFTRRHAKAGWPMGRRMLCTLDRNLLLSLPGRMTLNFKVPSSPPPYIAAQYGLVTTFDLFWQDWRNIPVAATAVVSAIPSHTKQQQDEFWAYFSSRFQEMNAQDKISFMKTA
tara:strand:- start:2253 stop:2648 length:396 start_codon:yes stop_codon:yes gene_type:complete